MAKRIDSRRTERIVVLYGKWRILAYENDLVWLNNKEYDSRQEASEAAGEGLPANVYGWTKLGPSPSLNNDGVARVGHSTKQ